MESILIGWKYCSPVTFQTLIGLLLKTAIAQFFWQSFAAALIMYVCVFEENEIKFRWLLTSPPPLLTNTRPFDLAALKESRINLICWNVELEILMRWAMVVQSLPFDWFTTSSLIASKKADLESFICVRHLPFVTSYSINNGVERRNKIQKSDSGYSAYFYRYIAEFV